MPANESQPLVGDPNRKANATIAAFDYQLWQTLLAWSRLKETEVLYVEGAEDYDVIQGESAYATQIKASLSPLSMASDEIVKAINNFWILIETNQDRNVHCVFISKAGIACEKDRIKERLEPLLKVWIRGARLDGDGVSIARQIASHKKCAPSLSTFLHEASPDEIQVGLIRKITWQMEALESEDCQRRVNDLLVAYGAKFGVLPREAKAASSRLYQQVMLAAKSKNAPPLTQADFLEAFDEATKPTISSAELKALRESLTRVGNSASSSSEVRSSVREWRMGPPPISKIHSSRSHLTSGLVDSIKRQSLLFLHGSTGMGKTTLANLTVRLARGNWLWWSGRGIGIEETRSTMRHLRFLLREAGEKSGLVLDDLNLSPDVSRQFEVEIADLTDEAAQIGLMVLVTSQKPPSQSLLAMIREQPLIFEAPPFSEDDTVETAQSLGCPDPDAIRKMATLLIGGCRGHPQLIHAHLQSLRRESWADVSPQRFVTLSRESNEPANEAVSLVGSLPDSQRQLLWRLSLIRCPFTRNHALQLADFPPPSVEPGIHFDALCGPWIESLHDGYYRVSPLLDRVSNNVLSPQTTRRLHRAISVTLWVKNLKDFEATSAFYHAWQAQDGGGLATMCVALGFQKAEVLEQLGWGMLWFMGEGLGQDEVLFRNDQAVSITLRIFQFRIAASVAPSLAKVVFERLEDEFQKIDNQNTRDYLRQTIALLPWTTSTVTVTPKTMLKCLGRILNSKNVPPDYSGPALNAASKISASLSQLVPMTMAWCNNIEQLNEWITALDQAEKAIREAWLGVMAKDEHALHAMIERAWLNESDKTDPSWPRAIEVLKALDSLGAKFGSNALRTAAATALAIVFYDYMHDPDRAALVLEGDHSKNSDNPFILDRLARLDAAQGRYTSAITHFRLALEVSDDGKRETASRRGFMAIQAAVCAGKLDDLEAARDFLELAIVQFQTSRLWDALIGAKADLGFVCFRLGEYAKSLRHWTTCLTLIQKRVTKATGLQEFAIRKASGHIIAWVFGSLCSKDGSGLLEPSVGFASNINPKAEIKELPESDWDILWVQLVGIGVELQCHLEFADALMPHLLEEPKMLVRSIAWMIEIHRGLADSKTNNLPEKLYKWAEALVLTKHSIHSTEHPGQFTPDKDTIGFAPYLVAILQALVRNQSLTELLAAWKQSAASTPWSDGLTPWFDTVSVILQTEFGTLFDMLENGSPTWERRTISALLICSAPDASPRQTAIAQYQLLISFAGDSIWRRRSRDGLITLFCAGTRRLVKSPSLLSNPRLSIPKMESAMMSSTRGYKKAAEIVAAAIEACGLKTDSKFHDQLQAIEE